MVLPNRSNPSKDFYMSTIAIEQALRDLQSLPEPEQQLVLGLVQSLKHRIFSPAAPRRSSNPAVQMINGALVFTGELCGPETDWLRVVREEREDEIIAQALGRSPTR